MHGFGLLADNVGLSEVEVRGLVRVAEAGLHFRMTQSDLEGILGGGKIIFFDELYYPHFGVDVMGQGGQLGVARIDAVVGGRGRIANLDLKVGDGLLKPRSRLALPTAKKTVKVDFFGKRSLHPVSTVHGLRPGKGPVVDAGRRLIPVSPSEGRRRQSLQRYTGKRLLPEEEEGAKPNGI